MWRCLVVANQTLAHRELLEELRARHTHGADTVFHVVVPATRVTHHALWTEGMAIARARTALDDALVRFRAEGLDATGEVGDTDPVLAVGDALRHAEYDEIVVSTLPPGLSRWMRRDLPTRLRHRYGLPVTHVAPVAEGVA
jgi:hypothetical protein